MCSRCRRLEYLDFSRSFQRSRSRFYRIINKNYLNNRLNRIIRIIYYVPWDIDLNRSGSSEDSSLSDELDSLSRDISMLGPIETLLGLALIELTLKYSNPGLVLKNR